MGLDMYLYAKNYLSDMQPEDKERAEEIEKLFPELADIKNKYGSAIKTITAEIGYWRKANAIHNWFVTNVQSGVDDCSSYYVSRDDLNKLRNLCETALNSRDKAYEILPTTSGFFFGCTEYDDWYFKTLENTIEIIDNALKLSDEWSLEYQSSW